VYRGRLMREVGGASSGPPPRGLSLERRGSSNPLPRAPRELCALARRVGRRRGRNVFWGHMGASGPTNLPPQPPSPPNAPRPLRRRKELRPGAQLTRRFGEGASPTPVAPRRDRGGGADEAPQTCRFNLPRYTANPRAPHPIFHAARIKRTWHYAPNSPDLRRGSSTVLARSNHKRPDSNPKHISSNHKHLYSNHIRPDSNHEQLDSNHGRLNSNHGQLDSNHTHPDSNHRRVNSNHGHLSSNHGCPQRDVASVEMNQAFIFLTTSLHRA
jgi:hypothetical protein